MKIAKNIHLEFTKAVLPHLRPKQHLKMKCKWKPFQKTKLLKLLLKELMHIHLNLVLAFFLLLIILGVPLSDKNATRSEPNKSAIDLAVKALKEKERSQKSYLITTIMNRPASSSIVAYHPKEQKKAVADVFFMYFSHN